ncbi:response regulator transcription factor [Bradyrhizobium paxllaeri]|uniref:response regulator transcription factor n=1 Tax=Bradyrhizobium paxllaeri TaxID=190148 RepID=UPI000810D658|nr:response regulator transcription factor [Bradyrhizobium paxllaeri]
MNMQNTAEDRAQVLIVDDDDEVRVSVRELVESVGLDTACFASTQELMQSSIDERAGCLVLDVRMPGLSGLDFQRRLNSNGKAKPIVFLTGHADIPMTVEAMKAGAVDVLTKPFREQDLLDAIKTGIERDVAQRAAASVVQQHLNRFETLTVRERQVLREVAKGRLNKQIAFDLGISIVTVKLHRCNVMRKMHATSVGSLIRAWEALPISRARAGSPRIDYGVVTN